MTPPRYNPKGTTWLVTRRCSERRFFLRPDSFVTRAILFILGYALAWFSLELHAAVALSNHWHLVITDLKGKKSQFFRLVHMMIARSVNTFRGRSEAFWAPGRRSSELPKCFANTGTAGQRLGLNVFNENPKLPAETAS